MHLEMDSVENQQYCPGLSLLIDMYIVWSIWYWRGMESISLIFHEGLLW